ncbi:MAG TPA: porin family protein [Saprospiraceae bacterium]|nr:porin family protein [Saprospiraceae bacterium]HNM25322.1 porin family protein [Saprospiraceae bacterium]
MKSFRNLAAVVALLVFTQHIVNAQIAVGLKTGGHFSTAGVTETLDQLTPDFKLSPGFTAGVVSEFNFGDYFALQPELNWVQKGFRWDESLGVPIGNIDIPVGAEAIIRTNYLELPLLAKGKFGNDVVQAYVAAGPSIGYALNGKLITKPRLLIEFDPIKTDLNLNNLDYERFEVSAVGALGVQFNIQNVKIFADARYTHGFTELYNFPLVNEKIRHRGISANIGVMYNLTDGN